MKSSKEQPPTKTTKILKSEVIYNFVEKRQTRSAINEQRIDEQDDLAIDQFLKPMNSSIFDMEECEQQQHKRDENSAEECRPLRADKNITNNLHSVHNKQKQISMDKVVSPKKLHSRNVYSKLGKNSLSCLKKKRRIKKGNLSETHSSNEDIQDILNFAEDQDWESFKINQNLNFTGVENLERLKSFDFNLQSKILNQNLINIDVGKHEKQGRRNNDTITDHEKISNKIEDYDSILNKYTANFCPNNSKKSKSNNISMMQPGIRNRSKRKRSFNKQNFN